MHDPQDLKLNERSQTQKVTCCMIPFIGNVQTRQIHRDRKQTWGARGWGREDGSEVTAAGAGSPIRV